MKGESLTLTASSIPGINYSWSGPNGFNSLQQNPVVSTNSTTALNGIYYVTATINACTNLNEMTIVDINLIPAAVASNNGPVMEDSTLSLSASTIADATYAWTGPGGFTSSLQNPLVSTTATLAMSGYYYLTVTANGCSGMDSTLVVINPGVGINETGEEQTEFSIFPNPASEWVSIENVEKQRMHVRFYNMIGECVLNIELNSGANKVDISSLSNGVYVVSLQTENRSAYRKICKQ